MKTKYLTVEVQQDHAVAFKSLEKKQKICLCDNWKNLFSEMQSI